MRPEVVGDTLVDRSEHRAALPGAYNTYRLAAEDPLYDAEGEDAQMLLWPLFFTGYVLDGFLVANACLGASTVVLSSASSKTAIATAHCLSGRDGVTVVGLTSPRNVAMVEALGLYDRVVTYDAVDDLDADETAVYVDFAGDPAVQGAVHRRFGERLVHSAIVGGTHWDQAGGDAGELPGAPPTFFFAPDHWGPDSTAGLAKAWPSFVAGLDQWLRIEHRSGIAAVESSFLEALDGKLDPSVGLVLSV
jgi:hypothetical protein